MELQFKVKMSSWIKLDKSFASLTTNKQNKRKYEDIVSTIEDDDSSQDSCDLNASLRNKKQKIKPLANLSIVNEDDSSEESSEEVEYNPDGTVLPDIGNRKIKPMLPIVSSTVLPNQSSKNYSTSKSKVNPSKIWTNIPKSKDENNLANRIDDSLTDSDEGTVINDTVIDESSTDSSMKISQVSQQQETLIDTQHSITPPVQPFLATAFKGPKKRRVRIVKGGMVERLKKSLSKAKSNLLFWQHHRSAELIEPGTIVTVKRVENTYGRILIHADINNVKTIFCLCSSSLEVREGDIIEVNFDIDRSSKTDTHVLYSYVDKVLLIKKGSS